MSDALIQIAESFVHAKTGLRMCHRPYGSCRFVPAVADRGIPSRAYPSSAVLRTVSIPPGPRSRFWTMGYHELFWHPEPMLLGIVSDTHGLLRPEVAPALRGVDQILHIGDVGKISILDELAKIAPVTAVHGNVDRDGACAKLPETEVFLAEGCYIYMLHDLKTLHLDPAAAKFSAVLHGHTHVPNFYTKKGVLYFNPGSCGPRRFDLPITLGILTLKNGELFPQIVYLVPDS